MIQDVELGTYVRVYDRAGHMDVEAADAPRIDAAVSAFLDNNRDRLIHMTRLDGDAYTIRASEVNSWVVSTPEGRRRSTELAKARQEEEAANRQAVGLWGTD